MNPILIFLFATFSLFQAYALDPRLEQAAISRPVVKDHVEDQDARFAFQQSFTDHPGLTIGSRPANPPRVMMFSLRNSGSSIINPRGLNQSDSHRTWNFQFVDQARESLYMIVRDQPFNGRDSHVNMQTEVHLFPRHLVPSVKDLGAHYQVTLSSGERMTFDKKTREVISGPFTETPIDYHQDRSRRKNPEINYQGEGLMIKISQRGENPRYEEVWGQKKMATVSFPSKYPRPCQVRPSLLWDHRKVAGEDTPPLTPLYKTDKDLYEIIERQCKWDLSDLKKSEPVTNASAVDDCVHCSPESIGPVLKEIDPLGDLIKKLEL